MKLKYAYPNERAGSILICDSPKPLRPAFDTEIEINYLDGDILKGNIVDWGCTKIGYVDPKTIREEEFEMRKRFKWFGKEVKRLKKSGWVRLKGGSHVEIELKNLRVIKSFTEEPKTEVEE